MNMIRLKVLILKLGTRFKLKCHAVAIPNVGAVVRVKVDYMELSEVQELDVINIKS